MKPKLLIHMKSGRSVALTLDASVAADYCRQYSDWLSVGDESDAPLIDAADRFGGRLVVHFSNIEYLEIEAP